MNALILAMAITIPPVCEDPVEYETVDCIAFHKETTRGLWDPHTSHSVTIFRRYFSPWDKSVTYRREVHYIDNFPSVNRKERGLYYVRFQQANYEFHDLEDGDYSGYDKLYDNFRFKTKKILYYETTVNTLR